MNQKQIYDLLVSVFTEFDVRPIEKVPSSMAKWSKIKIDTPLQVYTYNHLDIEDSIWYFSVFYNGVSRETMIPNKNTLEFIQLYKEIYLDIAKVESILDSISDRLRYIGSVEDIRDKKINNIIGL